MVPAHDVCRGGLCDPAGMRLRGIDPSWRVQREVSLADRHLVEWVAQANVGDRFPEPWRWASDPVESIIRTLVALGVIERPPPGAAPATVAREASAAARAWLEAHPVQAPAPPRSGPATGHGMT